MPEPDLIEPLDVLVVPRTSLVEVADLATDVSVEPRTGSDTLR